MIGMLHITVSGILLTEAIVTVRRAGDQWPPIPASFKLDGFLSSKPYRDGPIMNVVIEGRPTRVRIHSHAWTKDRRDYYSFTEAGDFPFSATEWRSVCYAKLGRRDAETPSSAAIVPLVDRILTRIGQAGWVIHRRDVERGVRLSAFRDAVIREVVAPDDLLAARTLATFCQSGMR